MYHNSKLFKKLEILTCTMYSILINDNALTDENKDNQNVTYFHDILAQKILNCPEYNDCLCQMKEDKQIMNTLGKMLCTDILDIINGDENNCLLSFLYRIYSKTPIYDNDIFIEEYLNLENFFYSNTITIKESAFLFNIEFTESAINLDCDLIINKVQKENTHFKKSSNKPQILYVIERYYTVKKVICEIDDYDKMDSDITKNISNVSYDNLEKVLYSIKLLKSSAVYLDNSSTINILPFHPIGSQIYSIPPHYTYHIEGEICIINIDDIDKLRYIFSFIRHEKDGRLLVALRRLSLGMERYNPEDKIIDFMIGFEALYLPKYKPKIEIILSKRVDSILASNTKYNDIGSFMVRMYRLRKKIVHGNKYSQPTREDIKILEDLLRNSLNIWIEDKDKFSPKNLECICR